MAIIVLPIWGSLGASFHNLRTLLSCYDSFVRRKLKKAWQAAPLCIFWTLWQERNHIVFGNEEQSENKLKWLFLSNMLAWVRMYIKEGLMPLIDFVDWLGSC